MAAHVAPAPSLTTAPGRPLPRTKYGVNRLLAPLGRLFFSAIFLMSVGGNFKSSTIAYVAGHGVPLANVLVPIAGLLALFGGVSVLLGFKTRWGAAALVAFLVPVTLFMHNFWTIADPQAAMLQQVMFMKNVSILGGALLLVYFGGGPLSLDAIVVRRTRRRRTVLEQPAPVRAYIEAQSLLPRPI
jgi:putative oxidoreductase